MILDRIRTIARKIRYLTLKIRHFDTSSGIKYDSVRVQTSPKGDALEEAVIRHLDDIEQLKKLIKLKDEMIGKVDLDKFTPRQRELIRLYYFAGHEAIQCAGLMRIKPCAVYRLKGRIEERVSE